MKRCLVWLRRGNSLPGLTCWTFRTIMEISLILFAVICYWLKEPQSTRKSRAAICPAYLPGERGVNKQGNYNMSPKQIRHLGSKCCSSLWIFHTSSFFRIVNLRVSGVFVLWIEFILMFASSPDSRASPQTCESRSPPSRITHREVFLTKQEARFMRDERRRRMCFDCFGASAPCGDTEPFKPGLLTSCMTHTCVCVWGETFHISSYFPFMKHSHSYIHNISE